jgi:hypothetical protein
LHLVVVLTKLSLYRKFIRTITALIARHVGQRNRGVGRATQSDKDKMENHFQFWLARPYTRIVAWGRCWEKIFSRHQGIQSKIGFQARSELLNLVIDCEGN